MKIVGPPERPVLNKWFDRPKGTVVRPPLSKALVQYGENVCCDTLSGDAIGYMCSHGANVGKSDKFVFLMSSAYGCGHGTSITPANFHRSMAIFAVRKAVKKTWLNDRDQFTIPDHSLGKLC